MCVGSLSVFVVGSSLFVEVFYCCGLLFSLGSKHTMEKCPPLSEFFCVLCARCVVHDSMMHPYVFLFLFVLLAPLFALYLMGHEKAIASVCVNGRFKNTWWWCLWSCTPPPPPPNSFVMGCSCLTWEGVQQFSDFPCITPFLA